MAFASVEREGLEDSSEVDRASWDASKAPRASSHGGSITDLPTPISLSAHLRLSFRPRRYREIMKARRERERGRETDARTATQTIVSRRRMAQKIQAERVAWAEAY